ncbi:MAG TPA: hypothetical protein VGG10_10655 [Rhizomicrobium sp.]|jgi:hypothetical protein
MKLAAGLLLAGLVAMPLAARADTIMLDDFQNYGQSNWVASGKGGVGTSAYKDNVSLRLTGGATATKTLSTEGYKDVSVTVSFAGLDLGKHGGCFADYSVDGGANWSRISRLSDADADGVTMHKGTKAADDLANQPKLMLRLSNSGPDDSNCWADDITVSGTATGAPRAPATGSSTPAAPPPAGRVIWDPNSVPSGSGKPHAALETGKTHVAFLSPPGTRAAAFPYDMMMGEAKSNVPVDFEAFAPPANARPPTNVFAGRLRLGPEREPNGFRVVKDRVEYARQGGNALKHLPPFDFAFVQAGDALIPVQRGPIASSDSMSEFVLEPGRVWDQEGDHGYTRAAIPFSLEEKNANCLHNGVLTFLFNKKGAVSNVAFQIASETCQYFQFDMWGRLAAAYTPGPVTSADRIVAAYAREVAARLPVKPIEQLAEDHPGADPSQFGRGIAPADMTLYGVVVDDVNYVSACNTRYGLYPYCDVLDLPSYSTAKSIFAGVAAMRLSALYPGMMSATVAQYVPQCAVDGTWNDVTLANTLDMATGHYNSAVNQADEDAPEIDPLFFAALDHPGHIRFSCTHYPRKTAPGTQWVYHTADTYALGTALNAFVKTKMGPSADVYRDVVDPIWRKLDLSPTIDVTRRTYDAVAQPFTGWGLAYHRDDIARIARFLNNANGEIGGQQILDRKMLDAALQRDSASPGIRAINDDFRYHDGFWAYNVAKAAGCKAPAFVPYMSGYGGITVAMMPDGITYYYYSDGGIFKWAEAAAEANRIKPFCT